MLERLGTAVARHPGPVIAAWIAIAVVVGGLARWHGGSPRDIPSVPGSSAQAGFDLLRQEASAAAGATAQVVVQAPAGRTLHAAGARAAVQEVVARARRLADVGHVADPYEDQARRLFPGLAPGQAIPGTRLPVERVLPSAISRDGAIGLITVQYTRGIFALPAGTFAALEQAGAPAREAGLTLAFGGKLVDAFNPPAPGISRYADEIGVACAMVILLVSLGSVAGMLVPVGLGLLSLSVSRALVALAERVVDIGTIGPLLGTMMGLGVGIDYSLFVVSRYRQNLAGGLGPVAAAGGAIGTAGAAVLFAGATVCLALCGLVLIGVPYIGTVGFTASIYVAVTVLAALTLLPALLGALGPRIDAMRLPWHRPAAEERPETLADTLSGRWARTVAERPGAWALASLAVLLLLGAPLPSMRLGVTDDGDAPAGQTQRLAYDLISQGFGRGVNGPLLVVLRVPPSAAASAEPGRNPEGALADALSPAERQLVATLAGPAVKILTEIVGTPGVQSATPLPLRSPRIAALAVVPTTGPADPATTGLIRALREHVIPRAVRGTPFSAETVYVTGITAEVIDFADRVKARLAPFMGAVLAGTFLLLMTVFRSLFVPFKAVVMNLLSIGASFGVLVAVFQWGWGRELIGLSGPVPIIAFVPMVMFAVLFGLSMDYEVFLLSRIREAYRRTGDSGGAVVLGLASTARVITSAALVMIAVFLAGATNPLVAVKMLGLGMAVAVLVDATIVRMVLVPSTMELMGRANWWLPGWLDRLLPRISID